MAEQTQTQAAAPQAQEPPASTDLSPKTVMILVVLALVVSFIGAWVNINQAMTLSGHSEAMVKPESTAQVGFTIQQPAAPLVNQATGKVTLTIVSPPKA